MISQPLSPLEQDVYDQLVATGSSREQALDWIRKRREKEHPRPPIPAGTVVHAELAAWWGKKPEDDPNPLFRVKAPDGAEGLTFMDNTEPV
jgi:hypothetical protein